MGPRDYAGVLAEIGVYWLAMTPIRRYALLLTCLLPLAGYIYLVVAMIRATIFFERDYTERAMSIGLALLAAAAAGLTVYAAIRISRETVSLRVRSVFIAHARIMVGFFCLFFMMAFISSFFRTTIRWVPEDFPAGLDTAGMMGTILGMIVGVLIGAAFIYAFGKCGYEAWWGVPRTLADATDSETPPTVPPHSIPHAS